ncbi:hypothetical protein [Loigolactobacillus jiayinensis]|nr:hypothetical protein [Loigolactobacillus jiayinensis]
MLTFKVPTALKQNAQVNRSHNAENIYRQLTRTTIKIAGQRYPRPLGKFSNFFARLWMISNGKNNNVTLDFQPQQIDLYNDQGQQFTSAFPGYMNGIQLGVLRSASPGAINPLNNLNFWLFLLISTHNHDFYCVNQDIRVVPALVRWSAANQIPCEDLFQLERRLQTAQNYSKFLEDLAVDYNQLATDNHYPTLVADLAAIYWE